MSGATRPATVLLLAITAEAALVTVSCHRQPIRPTLAVQFRTGSAGEAGVSLRRSDIEPWSGRTTTELLARVSGVRVVSAGEIRGNRLALSRDARTVRMARAPEDCFPLVVVDNVRWGSAADLDLDALASPDDLEAVDIYRGPTEVPAEFGASGQCGVIVFWTRKTR